MPALDELDETVCIPKDELEALADEWEQSAERCHELRNTYADSKYTEAVEDSARQHAQELREVLEQYE
jgi:CBS-domain-containing membrane protein